MPPGPVIPATLDADPTLGAAGGPLPTPSQIEAGSPPGAAKTVSALGAARVHQQRTLMGYPLRNVTPQLLASYLDSFQYGWLRSAVLLWDVMERRDPVVRTVSAKRYKAVSRLDWSVVKADDSPEAEEHQRVLTEFWNRIRVTDAMNRDVCGGVRQLFYQAASAIGHRWAVHEIVWDPQPGRLGATFTKVPLWFFENRTSKLRFLTGDWSLHGEDLESGGWLVHTGDGLMEPTSVNVVMRSLSLGDWLALSEKFGMPGLLWKTEAQYNSPEWAAAETAAAAFASDWAAVVSKGTEIESITDSRTGEPPQEKLTEYLERRIVMVWRGADLGTISQGQEGVGASLQGEETRVLLEDDAHVIDGPLADSVERHVLEWYFGPGVEAKAGIRIQVPKNDTTDRDLKVDEFLVGAGVPLSQHDAAERYGRAIAQGNDAVLQKFVADPGMHPPGLGLNYTAANEAGRMVRRSELESAHREEQALGAAAEGFAAAFEPLRQRLREASKLEDPGAQRAALLSIRADIPAAVRGLKLDPAGTEALMRMMGAATVAGMADAVAQRAQVVAGAK